MAAATATVAGALIGARVGPAMLDRPDRPGLQQAVARAPLALERYGHGKAIVLARFIPLVCTARNPPAGTVGVPARTSPWQVPGGAPWAVGVTLAGYLRGASIPSADRYLLPIIAVIIVLSLIPVLREVRRSRTSSPAIEGAGS